MALSKDDILNAIADMSVMDVVELISAMEEKFALRLLRQRHRRPLFAHAGRQRWCRCRCNVRDR